MREKWEKPEAILFDMDGTLFQTETLLIPVHERLFDRLRQDGLFEGDTPSVEIMLSSLGMLLAHIWERVMPGAGAEVHKRADDLLLELEIEGLRRGEGELYAGVRETLEALSGMGIRLFVASNGLPEYVKEIVEVKGLSPYIEESYTAGEYQTATKADLVRLLLDKHNIRHAWMVGDRSSDVEAGHANGLKVVGCAYAGFGKEDELANADRTIASLNELELWLTGDE
ncbi:HAD family hydrolase [Xylanibacillus composti]|uniref:MTA/SAH nucleosidase n=1 Tax=Xylanibacillus composti TaxID=1572762 RepID=A0A8J4M2N4_9BACL|nr:HAD family hydrolase [Xylanibacillus composti]MDT9724773.1 HAD family hydrolase [Xylanibacillus composti]GIQ69874.1 MTA/SAH nucleosidase [Xylanibacillus composti]